MDVSALAPALLALGEIFHEANALRYPDGAPVRLEIRAFNTGSFDVALSLGRQVTDQTVAFLTSTPTIALGSLITLVGGGTGVLKLIAVLGRKKVSKQESAAGGVTRLTLDDGTVFEAPAETMVLYQRSSVRRRARTVIAPLHQEGVDELRITVGGEPPVTFTREDADRFDLPPMPDTAFGGQELTMGLSITAVSFAEGNKWRLSDGERTFFATIDDEAFLRRVDEHQEAFMKGDILRCRVRVEQWQTDAGLRTDWTVTNVLEHIPATRTLPIPFVDEHDAGEPKRLE